LFEENADRDVIQIAYNRRFVAKFHDSKVEILSFTKNEIKTVVLEIVEKIDKEVYLQHFIEENEYFNSVKSSVSKIQPISEVTSNVLKTKETVQVDKPVDPTSVNEDSDNSDDVIDHQFQDDFLNLKNKTLNRFIFFSKDFFIYVDYNNQHTLKFIDLFSGTSFNMNNHFEVMQLVESPYNYDSVLSCTDPANVIILVGMENVLVVKIVRSDAKLFVKSVLQIKDVDFYWEKVFFVDPYKLAVLNQNNDVKVVDFEIPLFGLCY